MSALPAPVGASRPGCSLPGVLFAEGALYDRSDIAAPSMQRPLPRLGRQPDDACLGRPPGLSGGVAGGLTGQAGQRKMSRASLCAPRRTHPRASCDAYLCALPSALRPAHPCASHGAPSPPIPAPLQAHRIGHPPCPRRPDHGILPVMRRIEPYADPPLRRT